MDFLAGDATCMPSTDRATSISGRSIEAPVPLVLVLVRPAVPDLTAAADADARGRAYPNTTESWSASASASSRRLRSALLLRDGVLERLLPALPRCECDAECAW